MSFFSGCNIQIGTVVMPLRICEEHLAGFFNLGLFFMCFLFFNNYSHELYGMM